MKIWLDDERDPNKHGHKDYVWIKCPREFLKFIETNHRVITHLHLDHYLQDWGNLTGLDVMFNIDNDLEENLFKKLEKVFFHTSDESLMEKYFEYFDKKEYLKKYGIKLEYYKMN